MGMAESLEPWTESPPRLDVAVIGTGKAGSVLGAALGRAGHKVVACTAVSDISRLRAESLLPGVPVMTVADAAKDCDLVLLTVPDDVLPELVQGLAATGAIGPGTFVMHAAGRYGVQVLDPLTQIGCLPLALHPVMTFTGTSIDLNRLSGCPFGVTAPDVLRPVAEALVVEMGGDPIWVPEQNRILYHAGLAFGANGLMALVSETMSLLNTAGIEEVQRLVAPLLGAALDNAIRNGDVAMTGPIVRGDVDTVREHISEIEKSSPQTLSAYKAMARLTAQRALAAGTLSALDGQRFLELLGDN